MSESSSLDYNASNDAASAAFAKAVSLHLDGKFAEALQEVNRALGAGNSTPQLYSAKAHIQYELQQFDEAVLGSESCKDFSRRRGQQWRRMKPRARKKATRLAAGILGRAAAF
jgi:hypothetical protein